MTEGIEKRKNGRTGEILSLLEANPRRTILAMAAILALSIIGMVAYSVFVKPAEPDVRPEAHSPMGGLSHGMGQILDGGRAMSEALKVKKGVAHLLEKSELTEADSLELGEALRKLEAIQKQLNNGTR